MRGDARALALRHGVPFRFVECRADAATCRARLERREREQSVSDGRLAVFDAFCARYEPVTEISHDEHVILDTTRPLEETIARAREHLAAWPLGFVA
jgi:predicted kinase